MYKQRGFTLIEILIAIALIAVLGTSVVVLVDPVGQFKKGRDAERKSELSQIQTALELYRADQGTYPEVADMPYCGQPLVVGSTTYLQRMPCDPRSADGYAYIYFKSSPSTYILVACIENLKDPKKDVDNDPNFCDGDPTNWSYSLTNP